MSSDPAASQDRTDPVVEVWGVALVTPSGVGRATLDCTAAPASRPSQNEQVQILPGDLESTADLLPNRKIRRMLSRGVYWGVIAAVQALADAQTCEFRSLPERLGVFASGSIDLDELCHVHHVLAHIRRMGLSWRAVFGDLGTQLLPPFMLLRRLPNAAACHVAQLSGAKGFNATILSGPVAGLDCMRKAARAITTGRLDAALVLTCDSPLNWAITAPLCRMLESTLPAHPVILGEGAAALYLERRGLHAGRASKPYARYISSGASQALGGWVSTGDDFTVPRGLDEAVERATAIALGQRDPHSIGYLELTGTGVDWWDAAEQAALRCVPATVLPSLNRYTGYLGSASGGLGLARVSYTLAAADRSATAAMVVRLAPTGQCSAVLMEAGD